MRPEPMSIQPVILTGRIVRLEPLTMDHLSDLAEAARFDEVWKYLDAPTPASDEPIAAFITELIST